jgi:tetratricopeptide (TPR) repeat protein
VDLGRAYEKNDQTDKALDSYQKASEIVPDDPAAFLRLGVLYGRRQETLRAMEAFQKAESIYQRLDNFEGVAEVFYQRGALLNNLGRLDEARAQLEQVLAIARDNVHQRIRTLLQLSKVYYVDGKTTQARQYATDAITMAQVNRMENLSTGGLIELGRAFEFGGDYDQAEQYFNKALEFAEQYKGRHNEAKALLSLGRLHIDQHDADKGLPYVDQALAFYDRSGYRKETSEALIQMARAKNLKGDCNAALGVYEQTLQIAQQIDDQALLARTHADIGNALNQLERYPEALPHLDEATALYSSLNNHLYAGYCLADKGDSLWRLGRYQEARDALAQASAIANQDDKIKTLLAKIVLIETNLALSERRFPVARSKARQALSLNHKTEHEVDANYSLGMALASSGRYREGKALCEQAVEAALIMHDPQMLPSALLALAEVTLENGDTARALAAALEAQEILARIGRQESEWRALLVAALASQRTGNPATAGEYLSRANSILAELENKWGTQAFNVYLSRPDVQSSRLYLDQKLDIKK